MSNLREYLTQKHDALKERREKILDGRIGPTTLSARVSAEGRSGVRRIRIRDFQVITDSPPDFAGYNLGPSSPELQLGVLGSCLNHSYLIQAAALGVRLDSIEVEVTATLDPRGSVDENIPVYPHNIAYVIRVETDADAAQLAQLQANIERYCPILNLLKRPQEISGRLEVRPALRQAS